MRPADLPDFGKPPLNEVVLGVQFSPPVGYSQLNAGEVWGLFKEQYPHTEERMPLPAVFEAFGTNVVVQRNQLEFLDGPLHDRYWFLNQSRDQLIQFQQDRLLHNWRRIGSNEYPRFESMLESFESEANRLEKYLSSLSTQTLLINQVEVSYINHIIPTKAASKISDWLRFLRFEEDDPKGVSMSFREIISKGGSSPLARLTCEVAEGPSPDGQGAIGFTLTVRGAPASPSIASAIEFLKEGRSTIVRRFTELTTDIAHKEWERLQ